MNASPITSWDGAEAYFTFADNPAAMAIILALSVAVTVGVIIASIKHEKDTYIDYK
jgi:F0F1-type ATP synthase membrane subunit a